MKRVLVVGEINVDLILQNYHAFPAPGREVLVDDFVMTLGSASAIAAMGLARLGTAVAFLGKVGADEYGEFCLKTMTRAGIDTSRVVRDPSLKTGVTVSISSPQDRAFLTFLGSITALTGAEVTDEGPDVLAGFDHLHVSSYFLQEGLRPSIGEIFRRASRRGLSTSLDPGFDPSERWEGDLVETLDEVDVFFPNEVELEALTGEADPAVALRRLRNVRALTVAKLGRRGAMVLDGDRLVHVPAFEIDPVDTTGAGDSFNAGFLHQWLQGRALEECLQFGAACGALSTRGLGGVSAQATLNEATALMNEGR